MSEVEAPKAARTAPVMFANAKVPEEPAPGTEKEASSTSTEGGKPKVRSNGVPVTRLAGWALPLVLIVAGVALWSVNHRLALILFFLVAVVLLVGFVAHRVARRKANRQRATAAEELADLLTSGRQRGLARRSFRGRGGFLSRRSGGRPGGARRGANGRAAGTSQADRGSAATSTRTSRSARRSAAPSGKRSLRDRLAGRGRKATTGRDGSGRSTTTASGKRADDATSTSRRSRKRSSGAAQPGSGGEAGKKQPWWRRWHGRKTAPDAATAASTASKPRRSRRSKSRGETGDAAGGGATDRGGTKRSPWWRRRKRANSGDGSNPPVEPRDTKPRAGKRRGGGGDRHASTEAKPDGQRRWWRRRKDHGTGHATVQPGPQNAAGEKPKPAGADGDRRRKERKKRDPYRNVLVDDGGFLSPVIPKPSKEEKRKPAAKAEQTEPFPYDDGGFLLFPPPRPAPSETHTKTDDGRLPNSPHQTGRATSSTKTHERSTAVSDDVIASYMKAVDQSTAASRARTYADASAAAKRDSADFEAKGRAFRLNAGALQGKEGHVQAHVDHLLRQASACDQTAQDRLGISVGLAACADREATAAEKAEKSA